MSRGRKRSTGRRKSQNRLSILLAAVVMLVLLAVTFVRGDQIRKSLSVYQTRQEELTSQITKEQQRAKEIKEYGKKTQTDEYIEEVARDKLGLVKPGEIIFQNSSKE